MICVRCHQESCSCSKPLYPILDSRLPYLDKLLRYSYGTPIGIQIPPIEMFDAFQKINPKELFHCEDYFMEYIKTRVLWREHYEGVCLSQYSLGDLSCASDPKMGFHFVFEQWQSFYEDTKMHRDKVVLEVLQTEMPEKDIPIEWYIEYATIELKGTEFLHRIRKLYEYYGNFHNITRENDVCVICGISKSKHQIDVHQDIMDGGFVSAYEWVHPPIFCEKCHCNIGEEHVSCKWCEDDLYCDGEHCSKLARLCKCGTPTLSHKAKSHLYINKEQDSYILAVKQPPDKIPF